MIKVSQTTHCLVAVGIDLLIAKNAQMGQVLFWSSLIISLTVGLLAAYPVNLLLIKKGDQEGHAQPETHGACHVTLADLLRHPLVHPLLEEPDLSYTQRWFLFLEGHILFFCGRELRAIQYALYALLGSLIGIQQPFIGLGILKMAR